MNNQEPAEEGDIKLIVWDTYKNRLIQQYNFTDEEVSVTNSFLSDIGCFLFVIED